MHERHHHLTSHSPKNTSFPSVLNVQMFTIQSKNTYQNIFHIQTYAITTTYSIQYPSCISESAIEVSIVFLLDCDGNLLFSFM